MIKLKLFGTQGCHLCEQAEEILGCYSVDNPAIEVESIDIADYALWQELYAVRIPVLLHESSGSELSWPFDLDDVDRLVTKIR